MTHTLGLDGDGGLMDTTSWICGLMKYNYEAVGFIPQPTVKYRYISQNRYILQSDERGRPVGYLLHGALRRGHSCVISQHCIDYDARRRHYGVLAFRQFVERCEFSGVSSIHLRVAEDLPAVSFWQACGFRVDAVVPGGQRRGRMIVEMSYLLILPLLSMAESAHRRGVGEAETGRFVRVK